MKLILKPYSEYKDSGVPWLGQVPKHWAVKRNKLFLREQKERSEDGSEELLTVSQYTGVTRRRERQSEEGDLITNAASLAGYKRVRPGDLVMNIMLAWNGSLGMSSIEGIASPAYCVFRAKADVEPRFLHYLLRTPLFTGAFKAVSTGVVDSRLRLYPDVFFRLPSLLPPVAEQSAIFHFLDDTDRRIGRYIRTKQKLIKLLEEEKQVVIHRALTHGLADNAAVKSSGNPWFPEISKDWDLVPLRRLIHKAVDGPHFSPNYVDSGVTFISARNVKVDRWSLEDAKYISRIDYDEFSKRVVPRIGDVLYTKGGTTGVARVVDLDFPFQVWVHIAVLKLKRHLIDPYFLALALNSPKCYEQSQLFTKGATNQDLGLNRMKDIVLPVPPSLDAQRLFTAEVARAVKTITATAEQSSQEIELLREYRTRLIADVVTGKLDVRDAHVPAIEQMAEDLAAGIEEPDEETESPTEEPYADN